MPYKDIEKGRESAKIWARKWRSEHHDEYVKYSRERYKKHLEDIRLYNREWKYNKFHNDPEYREMLKARKRAYYLKVAKKQIEKARKWKRDNPDKVANTHRRTKEYRQAIKKECIAYLGGKCIRCGYDAHFIPLEFHHRNRAEKMFGIGTALSEGWTFPSLKPELDKCDLLCRNCHVIIEYEIREKKL